MKKEIITDTVYEDIDVKITDCDEGLTENEVILRAGNGLSNVSVQSQTSTVKQIVKKNTFTFFNLIMLIIALCLIVAGQFKDTLFLLVAVVNTLIGIIQEIRSKNTVDKLTLMTARKVTAIRDGKRKEVFSEKLVRDDIVVFTAGSQIVADAVVCRGSVKVNEALVTGEADAIDKREGDKLLSGSFIISGKCRARLTAVGERSYASKLTLEAKKNTKVSQSEIMRSLNKLLRFIGAVILPLGIGLFIRQYFVLDRGFSESMLSTAASVTGMIPDGLYLLTSVALAVSVMKLAKQKVICNDLGCVETLARVDVLCVDKTGTVTESRMSADEPIILNGTADKVESVLSAMYADESPDNDTARAMKARFCLPVRWSCSARIPFNSNTKWASATFRGEGSYIVGAPEFVMGSRYSSIRRQAETLNAEGKRVLVLAKYDGTPLESGLDVRELTPMALIPIYNKIRDDAPETFCYFAEQGVRVCVISGDNPVTVSEIARQAAIDNYDKYIDASVLHTEQDYIQAVQRYTVFGRVTPQQKRKLVRALKELGHTVAMTGDGVNDVLALKDADCGIAMASGAEAACRSAKLVLKNDNFSALPSVVDEGRQVVNNIQRAASLYLVKNIFSFLLSVVTLFVAMPYPLIPRHLDMISAVTIGIPSFFLALESNYSLIKGRFLLRILRQAFPAGIMNFLILMTLELFYLFFGFPIDQLHTMAAMIVTVIGLFVLYNVAKPMNTKHRILVGSMALLAVLCATVLNGYFEFARLSRQTALIAVVLVLLAGYATRTILFVFDYVEEKIHLAAETLRKRKAAKRERRRARAQAKSRRK